MTVATHRTKALCRRVVAGAAELQRGVRQLLADKVSGTLTGMWLLIPEYLRLGAWDLLRGWKNAGTMKLNIRHGRATLALIAQAALQQLRQRLPATCATWSTTQLARHLFQGLDGDIRVQRDTIIVTYYNAPHADVLAKQYVGLPTRLEQCNIDPRLPWLYGFKLDFRFK